MIPGTLAPLEAARRRSCLTTYRADLRTAFEALGAAAPDQKAPLVDDPRPYAQVEGAPDGFRGELAAAREKGQFEQKFRFEEVDGAWGLVPVR